MGWVNSDGKDDPIQFDMDEVSEILGGTMPGLKQACTDVLGVKGKAIVLRRSDFPFSPTGLILLGMAAAYASSRGVNVWLPPCDPPILPHTPVDAQSILQSLPR